MVLGIIAGLLLPLSAVAKVDLLLAAASEAELAPVRAKMSGVKETTATSWTFWSGTLAGRSVVLVRTEGDPLNAVAAVTLSIRKFDPALVLSYGVARAHDPALSPGDVVVSETFAAFDGFISGHRGLGEGTKLADWKKLPHAPISSGEVETYTESFPADAKAKSAALGLKAGGGARVVAGVLGSAHQINREADRCTVARCHLEGYQDTLYIQPRARVTNCRIVGGVDFIFGGGAVWFDQCEIVTRFVPNAESFGYLVAPSTPETQEFGLVFNRCRIGRERGVQKIIERIDRLLVPTQVQRLYRARIVERGLQIKTAVHVDA